MYYSHIDWVSLFISNNFLFEWMQRGITYLYLISRRDTHTTSIIINSIVFIMSIKIQLKKLLPYILRAQQCVHLKKACKHEIKLKNICGCNSMWGNGDNFLKLPIILSFPFSFSIMPLWVVRIKEWIFKLNCIYQKI